MSRGWLILIEGLDRSGKSTQSERLTEWLSQVTGSRSELWKFPDRTTAIGHMINKYLTDHSHDLSDEAIHLLFSANRWELAGKIEQTLESGTNIVLDRYYYSGIAFSAAKRNPAMTLEWCISPDIGLPAPDVTLFMDVSESVAQQRGGYGEERYEKLEFQRAVRGLFKELQQPDWEVILADGTIEETEQLVRKGVQRLLDSGEAQGSVKRFEWATKST